MINANTDCITTDLVKIPKSSIGTEVPDHPMSAIGKFMVACLNALTGIFREIRNEIRLQALHHNYSPGGSERRAFKNRGFFIRGIL